MPHDHIRKARPADVPEIHHLLEVTARTAFVIPRSQFELYATLRDFVVYDRGQGIEGCCALHITWGDLAEIKSLAVAESLRGQGIGRTLVDACLQEARDLAIARVFALTNVEKFFYTVGFAPIEKEKLPHKVWGECVRCPKFPNCDEVAVAMDLDLSAAGQN